MLEFYLVVILLSKDKDLYHVLIPPTWFQPPYGYRSLRVDSNLYIEHLSSSIYHGIEPIFLAGPLSDYRQRHNRLAPSRSGHKCLCHSMPKGGLWYANWEVFLHLHHQSPASKTLSQRRLQHSLFSIYAPIIVQFQGDGCCHSCYPGAVGTAGSLLSHHSGNGGWGLLVSPIFR